MHTYEARAVCISYRILAYHGISLVHIYIYVSRAEYRKERRVLRTLTRALGGRIEIVSIILLFTVCTLLEHLYDHLLNVMQ